MSMYKAKPTKTTRVGEVYDLDAPVRGARKVWWLIDNVWIPKGWMMPETGRTPYTKYPAVPS